MKMWVGCLAAYNNGRLHGTWCDISTDADENASAIAAVLKSSPVPGAEEFAVMDFEAPRAIADTLGENPTAQGLADAARLIDAIESRWPDPDDAAAVLSEMLDGQRASDFADLADNADDWISERYAGEGDTLQAWCADFLDETGFFADVPAGQTRDTMEQYFDFESYARDLRLGGDISDVRVGGRVLVFWNR